MATTTKITARRKLELSQVSTAAAQREALGTDIDITKLAVYLSGQIDIDDVSTRITSASIDRSIEGASTFSLMLNDYDRQILRSNVLNKALDIQVDGLWFRLTGFDKTGDDLTLTFQDREIEILRTYHKWKIAQRGQMTRAEFVLSLIREVKEYQIPVVIPELHQIQPIERYTGDIIGVDTTIQKGKGISKTVNNPTAKDKYNHREGITNTVNKLTVKNETATADQIQNANTILSVGDTMGVSRRLKVVAIMTAITESKLTNLPGGDADSAGVFQQRPSWGSYIDRTNVETSARLFFQAAIPVEKQHTTDDYWVIAADVQHPAIQYETRYALWRNEAEKFVNAYGDVSGTTAESNLSINPTSAFSSIGPFYYYRGKIEDKRGLKVRKPENTWACVQRLADDVNWRAFFVSGTFYFISEDDLMKQVPAAEITEFDDGIHGFDGTYDRHAKSATITVTASVGRWQVPPGSVVVVKDCGTLDGRWIVNSYSRDLLDPNRQATITLKKPRPDLPEPTPQGNASDISTTWAPNTSNSDILPPTKDIATKVLNNPNIILSNSLESSDIKFGLIDDRVLQALLFIANSGRRIRITAMRSDHSANTTEGKISAHSVGKAVDIGSIGNVLCASNQDTSDFMDWLTLYQVQLGFDQLIGPFPLKCLPRGWYDAPTLAQHKNHVHIGWPI